MRIRLLFLASALMLLPFVAVTAATVWNPTDGNINSSKLFSDPGQYGIFDDSDTMLSNVILTFSPGDSIDFTGTTVTNLSTGDYSSLSVTPAFRLGAHIGGVWVADSSFVHDAGNTYIVNFTGSGGTAKLKILLNDITPVPEPSVWMMMMLSIAGLMFMRRRNT